MAVETRPAISLEYLRCFIGTTDEDGTEVDPTGDMVAMAFVPEGDPVTPLTTFITASWETDDSNPAVAIHFARLLVGPTPGLYVPVANTTMDVYVRVTDNPEAPVIKSGPIRFT
jgi:hypothetical protein